MGERNGLPFKTCAELGRHTPGLDVACIYCTDEPQPGEVPAEVRDAPLPATDARGRSLGNPRR